MEKNRKTNLGETQIMTIKEYMKKYYIKNRKKLLNQQKEKYKKVKIKKKCKICNKNFIGNKLTKYCSENCRKIGTQRTKKQYRETHLQVRKKYAKKYRKENKLKETLRHAKYYKNNKKKILKTATKWKKKNLKYLKKLARKQYLKLKRTKKWLLHGKKAKERCNNLNQQNYASYGGKGIKFLLTNEEIEFLWYKFRANNMSKPCLHRKDSNKSYTLNNTIFMKEKNHIKLHTKQWKKIRRKNE